MAVVKASGSAMDHVMINYVGADNEICWNVFDYFAESAEFCKLIESLPKDCEKKVDLEMSQERVTCD